MPDPVDDCDGVSEGDREGDADIDEASVVVKLSDVVAQPDTLTDVDTDADTDAVETRDGEGAPLAVAQALPLREGEGVVDVQKVPVRLPVIVGVCGALGERLPDDVSVPEGDDDSEDESDGVAETDSVVLDE